VRSALSSMREWCDAGSVMDIRILCVFNTTTLLGSGGRPVSTGGVKFSVSGVIDQRPMDYAQA